MRRQTCEASGAPACNPDDAAAGRCSGGSILPRPHFGAEPAPGSEETPWAATEESGGAASAAAAAAAAAVTCSPQQRQHAAEVRLVQLASPVSSAALTATVAAQPGMGGTLAAAAASAIAPRDGGGLMPTCAGEARATSRACSSAHRSSATRQVASEATERRGSERSPCHLQAEGLLVLQQAHAQLPSEAPAGGVSNRGSRAQSSFGCGSSAAPEGTPPADLAGACAHPAAPAAERAPAASAPAVTRGSVQCRHEATDMASRGSAGYPSQPPRSQQPHDRTGPHRQSKPSCQSVAGAWSCPRVGQSRDAEPSPGRQQQGGRRLLSGTGGSWSRSAPLRCRLASGAGSLAPPPHVPLVVLLVVLLFGTCPWPPAPRPLPLWEPLSQGGPPAGRGRWAPWLLMATAAAQDTGGGGAAARTLAADSSSSTTTTTTSSGVGGLVAVDQQASDSGATTTDAVTTPSGSGGDSSTSSKDAAEASSAATSASTTTTTSAATSPGVKWTFLMYMLADNNLECFGILDLIEMMQGMAVEPSGCSDTACGQDCPEGFVTTGRTTCGETSHQSRCCPAASYPDVLVLADRGVAACSFSAADSGLDYSLLTSTWTSAREVLILPGGAMQQVRDLGEIDMASPDQLSQFLQRAFLRFPPTDPAAAASEPERKYALILWDHGNGWKGYGVDDTCSGSSSSSSSGCDQFTLATLTQGLAAGLADQPGRRLDILGFDACLMSMYEVAAALAPYARTLLASELLEPGHGWDYTALGSTMDAVEAAASGGGGGGGDGGDDDAHAAALAEIWISMYKAQAVYYQTTGVTLALTNLTAVRQQLVPALGAVADALAAAVGDTSDAASVVLRRRMAMATMGAGEQDSSVDVGSMLDELSQATSLDSASRSAISAALAAYNASRLAFGRDDELPRGTGMSIYFPLQASKMDSDYPNLATSPALASTPLASAASRWVAFLTALFAASSDIGTSNLPFAFLSSAASVPYLDVLSGSYVLQGVLNSQLALSAQVYYGFMDATDKSYVLAGSRPALVDGTRVVGVWRRLLWGVSQTINTTTTSSSSTTSSTTSDTYSSTTTAALTSTQRTAGRSASSLMFATEEWQTSSDGATAISVSLTANVRYGPTCSTARARSSAAILKYTFRFGINRATLQLFAQQPSGAYGEVSAQAGGVIVPLMYKLPRDFSGSQTPTYEYSGCLKWGYNGTVRVVPVNIAFAADTLGVDLDQEVLLFLSARDLSLSKTAYLVGSFDKLAQAHTTVGGCQCLTSWRYTAASGSTTASGSGSGSNNSTGEVYSGCANPNNAVGGPWCMILAGSCTQPGKALGAVNDSSSPWDFCAPTRTLSGCSCSSKYPTDSSNFTYMYGRCYRGDTRADTRGAWCAVNQTTCPSSYRAHGSSDTSYDYCETQTVEGCYCLNSWSYNGVTYNGTCATGFGSDTVPEGFTNSSRWCRVRPGCSTRSLFQGRRIGLCSPAVPRVSNTTNTTCALPATLYGGVPVYNCVPYRNGPTAGDLQDGIAGVCPVNAAATAFETCAARNCTALDLSSCPATLPQATANPASSPWVSRACLAQLCAAAVVARDRSTCTEDGSRAAAAAAAQLNSSAAVAAVLASSYGAASLDAYCAAVQGTDCLTASILPACPAVRLNASAAYDSAYVDDSVTAAVCRTDCLRALCTVAGTKCARARLVESLRLQLLEAMDTKCFNTTATATTTSSTSSSSAAAATALSLTKPAALTCAELTAPAPSCAASTSLTAAAGEVALRPVTGSQQYAPLSNCTWVIQPAGLPYINLTFRSLSTEPVYDTVLIEDEDEVLAVVSGGAEGGLPGPIVTDTGRLTLTFVSDSSIQMAGFSANYTAMAARVVPKPTCAARQQLVQVTMVTKEYGNEVGWVASGFRVSSSSSSSSAAAAASQAGTTATTSNSTATAMVSSNISTSGRDAQPVAYAAGGQLPATAFALFSATNISVVRYDSSYKSNRTYTTYACLPVGVTVLYMYDGYGDGWAGGSLTVSYMPNTSSTSPSYTLATAAVDNYNATATLNIFAKMPGSAADYATALSRHKSGGQYSLRFTMRLAAETTGPSAVAQGKQQLLRGAVASLLTCDSAAVSVVSVTAAAAATTSASAASSTSTGRRLQLYDTSGDVYDAQYDYNDAADFHDVYDYETDLEELEGEVEEEEDVTAGARMAEVEETAEEEEGKGHHQGRSEGEWAGGLLAAVDEDTTRALRAAARAMGLRPLGASSDDDDEDNNGDDDQRGKREEEEEEEEEEVEEEEEETGQFSASRAGVRTPSAAVSHHLADVDGVQRAWRRRHLLQASTGAEAAGTTGPAGHQDLHDLHDRHHHHWQQLEQQQQQQQQQRRRLQGSRSPGGGGRGLLGLDDLLTDVRVTQYDLSDLVSVHEPQFLGKGAMDAAEAAEAAGGQQQAAPVVAAKLGSSTSLSAKVNGGEEAAAEAGGSSEGDGGESGGDGSGSGYTVLFNGLVLDSDGVPVFSSVGPASGTSTSTGSVDKVVVPRTLVSGPVGSVGAWRGLGGGGGGGASGGRVTVITQHGREDIIVRQHQQQQQHQPGASTGLPDEIAWGLEAGAADPLAGGGGNGGGGGSPGRRRNSNSNQEEGGRGQRHQARVAAAATAAHEPRASDPPASDPRDHTTTTNNNNNSGGGGRDTGGDDHAAARAAASQRNGGRTPVPRLPQLLPLLLGRAGPHLAAAAAATGAAGATGATGASNHTRGSSGGAAAPRAIPFAAAVEDAAEGLSVRAGALSGAASLTLPLKSPTDGAGTVAEAAAEACVAPGQSGSVPAAEGTSLGKGAPRPQVRRERQDAAEVAAAPVAPAVVAAVEGQQQEQRDEAQSRQQRRQRRRGRRRLQQSPSSSSSASGTDVVMQVSGYTSQEEAAAAGSQLQAMMSSELRNLLGDAGWNASPSLVTAPQVLQSGQVVSSPAPSSGGTNWGMLAVIIGASVGGALLLLALVVLAVLVARRRAAAARVSPEQDAAGKTGVTKVQPAARAGGQAASAASQTAGQKDQQPQKGNAGAGGGWEKENLAAGQGGGSGGGGSRSQSPQQGQQGQQGQPLQQQGMQLGPTRWERNNAISTPEAWAAGGAGAGAPPAAAGSGGSWAQRSARSGAALQQPGLAQRGSQGEPGGWQGQGGAEAATAGAAAGAARPATGTWMTAPAAAPAAAATVTPVAPMYGAAPPYGMPYPPPPGDPYGGPYAASGAPYGGGGVPPGYDPYGVYGNPNPPPPGAYPPPPPGWGGAGAGAPTRQGWQ